MRVRATSRSLIPVVALLVACREDVPQFPAVWPPEEGAYCADAPDVCAAEGTAWRCGPRPFWQRLDCATVCAAQGGEPHGCLMPEVREQRAAAALNDPQGFLTDDLQDASQGVRCLCQEAAKTECAGPFHRTCAGRGSIWSCSESMQWEEQDCAEKCAALDPPMALDQCQHNAAELADRCRCTMLGAPCPEEGLRLCADSTEWMLCELGVWRLERSCAQEMSCEYPQVGACDLNQSQTSACRCKEPG